MASSSEEKPCAIPILTCEDDGNVRVHEEAIQKIFRRPNLQDKPVCIISISGASRKGKSFMLNFFVRYLLNKGHVDKSWMTDENTPMKDGFEWRGGRKGCTNGILVWSEVFTVKRKDGEVAVILMDTQGLFDNKMSQKTNSIIFALSTLMSSVQIFNVTEQIQESDLGFLQFFTSYSEAAHEAPSDVDTKPFQTLVFLVRDWPHAAEISYGATGGENYLNEVLSAESSTEELSTVRKYLTSSFNDTKCCLLPSPGEKVSKTSTSFTGCLKDIDKDFLRQTALFVDSLLHPKNLVVKTINGRVVSAPAMLQYISHCGKSLTDGKLPDPKTMVKNVAETQNFECQRRCREKYIESMNEVIGESFVDNNVLQHGHTQALTIAMNEFGKMTRLGDEESRRKHGEYLEDAISYEYRRLAQANQSAKANSESRVIKLIDRIGDQLEAKMKKAISNQQFLSKQELDRIFGKLVDESRKEYELACTNTQLKVKNLQRLLDRLEKAYLPIKFENNNKMGIAEEQNELLRRMKELELQYAIQYRDEMREHAKHYMDEGRLKQMADGRRQAILDEFNLKALEERPDSNIIQDRQASLKAKLDEEYEHILRTNSANKGDMEIELESHRQRVILDYQNIFRKLLTDDYMEKKDLIQKHEDVVEELMSKLRSVLGERCSIPIVALRLVETEKELSNTYAMIQAWNKKKKTFWRRISKAANETQEFLAIMGDIREVDIEESD